MLQETVRILSPRLPPAYYVLHTAYSYSPPYSSAQLHPSCIPSSVPMHPSCHLSFSQLDGGRVRCGTLTNPLDRPFTGQTLDSRQPPSRLPPLNPSANVASCLAACPGRTHDPGPCPGRRTGTASSSNSWPWLARAGVPLSPSVSAPPTRPPYRATSLCCSPKSSKRMPPSYPLVSRSFYSQICVRYPYFE